MKLAIDLQACQTDSRDRGIGRYALSLSEALLRNHSDTLNPTIVLDAVDPTRLSEARCALRDRDMQAPTATFGYPSCAHFTDHHPFLREAAGLLKAKSIDALQADVLLVSSFFEFGTRYCSDYTWKDSTCKRAVVAYDLIPLLYPEHYLPDGHVYTEWYRNKIERFKQFDLYLAISEATKRDLIERIEIPEEKIAVICAGLDDHLACGSKPEDQAILSGLGIMRPFVLMVGNADWRKNCIGALDAFLRLPEHLRNTHQLVFTRVGDDVVSALATTHREIAGRVVVAGAVSEDVLACLYHNCRVFYFPSLYEGFGLPVLEAMAAGSPVLSSNAGSLPEVCHLDEMLFDPLDAEAGARLLARALEDDAFVERLSRDAKEQAHSFTWDRCAALAAEALQGLAPANSKHAKHWRPDPEEIELLANGMGHSDGQPVEELRESLARINLGTKRRLLVDISEVVRLDARSGIQRVVRNYCAGLHQVADGTNIEVIPISWTASGFVEATSYVRERLGLEHIDTTRDGKVVEPQPNDIVFMVDSSWIDPERFNGFHDQVRKMGGEIVWEVYDLVPINHSEYCDSGMPPVFKKWLDHVIAKSDGIVCISKAVQCELLEYMERNHSGPSGRPWVRYVHLGSDLESGSAMAIAREETYALLKRLDGIPKILAIGTVEPRKDYETILRAMDLLWEQEADAALFIIGKRGWNVDQLSSELKAHPKAGHRLFWLEGLDDADLQQILVNCDVLVQASIAEGFGLPVIEAGSLGRPLILSELPVFREIAAEEAEYFPPRDFQKLAAQMKKGIIDGFKSPSRIRTKTWLESSTEMLKTLVGNRYSTETNGEAL